MNRVKEYIGRRWKQIAGIGFAYLALEAGAVLFVALWSIDKVAG